jgi:hypothetical protein
VTARTVPVPPVFTFQEELTSSIMNSQTTWMNFWSNPPMFRMYQTVGQSIGNLAFTQLTMDTPDYDTDSGRALTTPWSYVVPVGMGGRWRCSVVTSWSGNATGVRGAALFVNGVQALGAYWANQAAPAANISSVGGSTSVKVNAGDTIAAYGYQGSGGALSTNVAGGLYSYFEGRLESLANP